MNDITLDFGATAQKQTEGETPVVLLALDQGRYDMDRSLAELTALAEANGMCDAGRGQSSRSALGVRQHRRGGCHF